MSLCHPMDSSMTGFPALHHLPELAQNHVHWVGDVIQPYQALSPLFHQHSKFPSIRVFANELALHISWPNIGASASASVPPLNIQDWFPLGFTGLICSPRNTHKSSTIPQFKVSTLRCSAFFMDPFSHLYMTARKNISLTIWTFVHKAMSLLLNMLSMFLIAFFPRSKHLLISQLWSSFTVILKSRKE